MAGDRLDVALRKMLLEAPEVAGIVGTRVHPYILPQDATFPALTYFLVESPDMHLEGVSGIIDAVAQVSAWALGSNSASGYTTAQRLIHAAQRALLGRTAHGGGVHIMAVTGGRVRMDPPDTTADLWHAILEIRVIARVGG